MRKSANEAAMPNRAESFAAQQRRPPNEKCLGAGFSPRPEELARTTDIIFGFVEVESQAREAHRMPIACPIVRLLSDYRETDRNMPWQGKSGAGQSAP
ncbi:MAG TPA: hypothetical protein VHY22_04775 [Chthoniobacteraceae bacterium]|jgi:hypothetical protein|nr:hypothetical protein [Chthoniobacteraceae bacterium]